MIQNLWNSTKFAVYKHPLYKEFLVIDKFVVKAARMSLTSRCFNRFVNRKSVKSLPTFYVNIFRMIHVSNHFIKLQNSNIII